jgi:hypothetical protein
MRIVCEISKATNTNSEYVFLVAFTREKCLKERAAVLRYTCISSLTALVRTSVDNGGQQSLSKSSEEGKKFE